MAELTSMANNKVTVSLIDLLITHFSSEKGTPFGVFIVMEYMDTDLASVIDGSSKI